MNRNKLRADVQRWGLLRAFYSVLMERLRPRLLLCAVTSREYSDGSRMAVLRSSPNEVRLVSRTEALNAASDESMQLTRSFIDAAVARGDVCIGAFDDGRLVAYRWRASGSVPHSDQVWVDFDGPYHYEYKAFTHPEYRGRNLTVALSRYADEVCQEQGYTHAINFVESHNFASIRSNRRKGNRTIGYAGYLVLFGRVLPLRSSGARKYGFRFTARARATPAGGTA